MKTIKKAKEFNMKITPRLLTLIISLAIPLLTLASWNGYQRKQIETLEKEDIFIRAELVATKIQLKNEIEKKVDIVVFNSVNEGLSKEIGLLRKANVREHKRMFTGIDNINLKLDKMMIEK